MKVCLIVDDASVIRKIARHIIESMRYLVVEAESGQQAIEACRTAMPDVILLDWQMPGMSAIEFLAALRASPGGRHPSIIYCTTEHDSVDISRAFAAGADSYLMKPFDRETIEAKFSEALATA